MDNKLNYSFFTLKYNESFLEKLGSVKLLDAHYMFLLTPFSFIGFILNLVSLRILLMIKEKESITYYKYLRVYCVISSIICFIYQFSFICFAPRYHNFYLSYFARFYRTYMVGHFGTTLYFVVNTLDICLAFERFAMFNKKYRKHNNHFWFIIFMVILLCFIVNLPSWLALYPITDKELYLKILSNSSYINLSSRTRFAQTFFGKITILISVFIREFVSLLIELILLVITVIKFRLKIKNTTKATTKTIKYVRVNINDAEVNRIKSKRNFTLLTICLMFMSFITHFVVFFVFIMFYVRGYVSDYYRYSATLSIVFKNFSNFFIFYFFNKKFRAILSHKKIRNDDIIIVRI